MEKKAFEGLTCFSQKMKVNSLNIKNCKHLILESNYQPGYYSKGDFPVNKKHVKDHHLYLPVKKSVTCFQDVVLRIAAKINNTEGVALHISPGQMTFQNKDHQCIRIRAGETENLNLLISELEEAGIGFFKAHKTEPFQSTVIFKRWVRFKELFDGIYQENELPHRYFIEIPKNIDLKLFEQIIDVIKNSCDFYLFDSFLANFITKNKVIDFAGIYSKHCDKNRLTEFKSAIEKEFQKLT